LFSISVAVGLTPEMLPMIVNTNLAKGALSMAKKRTIIKKMESIINFGAMDVLCTDKTGTLTQNKVVLLNHLNLDGDEAIMPLEMAYLNSYFQTSLKNLLDIAIIEYYNNKRKDSQEEIMKKYVKVDEIPFDFVRRRMSVILKDNTTGEHLLISKGAVDEMLQICSQVSINDQTIEFTKEMHLKAKQLSEKLNTDGLRMVAVGVKKIEQLTQPFEVKDEVDLTFVGFITFLDPPKDSTAPAIKELIARGVEVKVLTGDSPLVCKKVCEQVGLPIKGIITTNDIKDKSEEELSDIAEQSTIFAKLTPLEKANVVKVLRKRKHIVGFLGDGINDSVALRTADVGISVEEAVDIAKESADIILLEKSLLVLVKGVICGRKTYFNTLVLINFILTGTMMHQQREDITQS
jgi:Mg2+-importing ATPase